MRSKPKWDVTFTRVDIPEEEARELHVRALAGDIEARNRIVEANLPLAAWYVKYHARKHRALSTDELLAAAMRGLIDAATHHNPARGTQFATTAYDWMRKEAYETASETRYPLTVPVNFRKSPGYFLSQPDRFSSVASARALISMRRASDATLGQIPTREHPDNDTADPADVAELKRRVANLPDKYRHALSCHYGLDCTGMTMSDVQAVQRKPHLIRDAIRRIKAAGPIGHRTNPTPPCHTCGQPMFRSGNGYWCRPCRDRADGIHSQHAAQPIAPIGAKTP